MKMLICKFFKWGPLVFSWLWASISLSHATGIPSMQSVSPQTEGDQKQSLSVIDWDQEISLPDDILYVPHASGRSQSRLIFLVSLDARSVVISVQAISGFSLYLSRAVEQIKGAKFSPDLAGKAFVLRAPDPLQKTFDNWKLYRTEVCTSTTDLPTLYRVGALRIGRGNDGDDIASRCYKFILDRKPSSVAARYGVARICIVKKDTCADSYLQGLIASNPEFIEAREALAGERAWPEVDNAEHITALENILKLDLSLSARTWVLNQLAFSLNRMNQIDDALRVIKKWNRALAELMTIYPLAASAYYTEAIQFGLLEEAKEMNSDAINTYRQAASIAALDRMVPDSARYEIDLGLARALRRFGKSGEAKVLCDSWSSRWRRLVSRPPRHSWERWEDGVGELEGRWEFSCGSPDKGFQLIEAAAKQYPESDSPYSALAEYYYSLGKIEKARDAEATANRLRAAWAKKLGEF